MQICYVKMKFAKYLIDDALQIAMNRLISA